MAETLGQAVLELRTDDSAFTAGVNRAEVAATGLGKTLDACSGSSAKLAAEITEAANSGNQGAQAWLAAGTAIDRLAAAQVEATAELRTARLALEAGKISEEEYRRQKLQTVAALAIYQEEHRRAQAELRKTIANNREATSVTAGQRQGLIQLTQQLGDASTMYALGAKPMMIFASQLGQVAQAVQLAAGEGSKFAAFLSGPWGIGIMVAVQVLGPLIGKLFDTGAAADDAASKLRNAADAARELAGVSNALKLNAAQIELNSLRDRRLQLENSIDALGNVRTPVRGKAEAIAAQQSELLDVRQKILGQESIVNLAESQNAALDATKSGRSARGAGRSGGSGSGGASAVTDPLAFARELGTAARAELQARQALATSAGERLDIQMQILDAEREEKIRTIDANKNFTADQKAAMKAYVDRLYGKSGKVGPDGSVTVDGPPGLLGQAATRKFEEEQNRLANDMLQRQAETAQAWAQVAPSVRERARLEARALELQQQIEMNLLEQQIATGQVADAEKARAELRSQQEAARKGLADRSAGPLAQYADQLAANKEDSGRRVEALMVQELDYVHRSITDTISSRLGVEDPFLKGLIDMFIEEVLIRPMAEALRDASSSGGGGGGLGSLFKSLFGGGGGTSLASLTDSASATISDPQFAGLFAGGGLIPDGAWGIVGEAGPEPIRAAAGGIEVLPNSALRGMGGAGGMPGTLKIEVSGARGNREIEAMVRSGVAQGLAAYDTGVAGRVRDQMDRRS